MYSCFLFSVLYNIYVIQHGQACLYVRCIDFQSTHRNIGRILDVEIHNISNFMDFISALLRPLQEKVFSAKLQA